MKDLSELDLWNQPDEGDPLVWLRKHRDENARKYLSAHDLGMYLKTLPSVNEMLAEIEQKIDEKHRIGYQSSDLYTEQE